MDSKYIEIIYRETASRIGKTKAKEYVATTLFNILFDLEESGLLSSESITNALREESEFCAKASSSEVA